MIRRVEGNGEEGEEMRGGGGGMLGEKGGRKKSRGCVFNAKEEFTLLWANPPLESLLVAFRCGQTIVAAFGSHSTEDESFFLAKDKTSIGEKDA